MFGWLGGRSRALQQENERLQAELLAVKSASPQSIIADTTGGMVPAGQPNLGQTLEQLQHFRSWQFIAINAICKRIAGQPIHVGRVPTAPAGRPPGGPRGVKAMALDDGIEPIISHPLKDLLLDPNDVQVAWSMMYVTVASLMLTGRSFWWIKESTRDDRPYDIWPLPSHWLSPVHGARLFERWKVKPDGDPEGFTLPGDDIAYFPLPDPLQPLVGAISPLACAARAVNADEAIELAQLSAFKNGVHPSILVKVGRMKGSDGRPIDSRHVLTPEQRGQLLNTVKKYLAGVFNRGEALIVDGMIEDASPFGLKPSEMDFCESGEIPKNKILMTFGVNPITCGQIENANKASSWAAEHNFCSATVQPLQTFLGQVISQWVAPRFAGGERLRVYFKPAVARDHELEQKQWAIAATRGFITPNEFRIHQLGLQRIDTPGADDLPDPGGAATIAPEMKRLAAEINPYTLKRLEASGNGKRS